MFFSLWLYLFNHWVLNFRLDLCQRVPHSRTVWIHALDIHRDWWIFFVSFFLDAPQLIFSGEYTKAMSKDWHLGHFSCWQCDESLTGQRYVLRDEHPYCVKCYETVFANTCDDCNRIIGIDSKVRKTLGRIQQQLIYTIANRRRKLLVGHMSQPKTRTYYSDRLFFSSFYGALRICRTRIATGTRPVSCATSAGCRWSTSNSAPRLTRFSAARATTLCTRLGATDAAKSSAQVHSPSLYLMSYLGAYL